MLNDLEQQRDKLKEQLKRSDEMSGKHTAEYIELKKNSEKQTADFAECCKALDERRLKIRAECDRLRVEFIQKASTLETERDELKKELQENIESSLIVDAQREDAVNEKTTLKRRLQETEDKYVLRSVELVDLRKAINGHTPENLKEIMKGIPEPADLEHSTIGAVGSWDENDNWNMSIILTPVVEYIEGDAITDAMVVAAGGRVPCDVRRYEEGWIDDTLFMVDSKTDRKFVCQKSNWQRCRIKTSDLPEASE